MCKLRLLKNRSVFYIVSISEVLRVAPWGLRLTLMKVRHLRYRLFWAPLTDTVKILRTKDGELRPGMVAEDLTRHWAVGSANTYLIYNPSSRS